MRISRKKGVRHALAGNMEVPLIFDPRRRTGNRREEQRIRPFERNRGKPPVQFVSGLHGDAVRFVGDVVRTERHDRAQPGFVDVLTEACKDLLYRNGNVVDREEPANRGHRVMKEDWPGGAAGQCHEVAAELDLYKLGACVLDLAQHFTKPALDVFVDVDQVLRRRVGESDFF